MIAQSTVLLFCSSVALGICACGLPDDPAQGGGEAGTAQETSGGPGQPADGGAGQHAPFVRACQRMHSECSAVCDNLFFECYDDVETCAEQWEAEYLDDFEFPMIDPVRTAQCAEQVETQACTSLEPDTAACDYAIVEQCVDDADEFGQPYSPFWAAAVSTDTELSVHLCNDVEEFFLVSLQAGDRLQVQQPDDAPYAYGELIRLGNNAVGDALIEEFSLGEPVATAGEYIVVLSANTRADHTFVFARNAAG